MKIARYKMIFHLNTLMMTTMFSGYILTTGLEVVSNDAVKIAVRSLVALTAAFVVLYERKIKLSIISYLYLFLILLTVNQNEISANILFLLLTVASVNRLDEKDAALVFLIASALTIFIHIFLLATGTVSMSTVQVGERERSALGFANANQFALVYLTLICSAFFAHKNIKTAWSFSVLCISLAISIWMMKISDSRTSMLSVVLLLSMSFFWLIFSKNKVTKEIFILGAAATPIIACAATYLLTTNTDPLLDIALSFRPSLFSHFLSSASWQDLLLGWNLAGDNVDNGYLMLLSSVGLPIFLAIILAISKRTYQSNPHLLPICGVVLTASIFESFLVRPEIPLSIMFFSIIFRSPHARFQNTSSLAHS